MQKTSQHKHYELVARAIIYLKTHYQQQPSLQALSEHLNISPEHLQKVFSQWAGISPKQFLQFLSKEHAKDLLKNNSVLTSALSTGYSSTSRLHDVLIKHEAITPGEYKSCGKNLEIRYGYASTAFGYCFIAITQKGICHLSFFENIKQYPLHIAILKKQWSLSQLIEDHTLVKKTTQNIFTAKKTSQKSFHALFKGTPFQIQVWQALLAIPSGQICSYQSIAKHIEKPRAVRALASAIAKNNIAYLIPCHRVIRSDGTLNHYRWNAERKAAILLQEQNL